jgi:hypothetical protein
MLRPEAVTKRGALPSAAFENAVACPCTNKVRDAVEAFTAQHAARLSTAPP